MKFSSPLSKTLLGAAISLSLSTTAMAAELSATGDDGREILLKKNGSWEYKSTDRFATSEDGTRVRLKADGSWEFIGNAPSVSKEQVRTEAMEVKLGDIVTEFHKEKVGKNTRYNSQTTFNLAVDISNYSEGVDTKLSHFNLFKVTDSRGNDYPVIEVTPQTKHMEPGKEYPVAIRVDGSPSGQFAVGIKYLYLEIDKAVFGSETNLKFSRRADEAKKVQLNRSLR
ncbi:hypothetical protein [Pseudomaricurvus sp.]|uniref:hypothetical protein n=1 Tax=Pseudomaricurvus sp. TaxID=2004510 RepID=UPI003F6D1741